MWGVVSKSVLLLAQRASCFITKTMGPHVISMLLKANPVVISKAIYAADDQVTKKDLKDIEAAGKS